MHFGLYGDVSFQFVTLHRFDLFFVKINRRFKIIFRKRLIFQLNKISSGSVATCKFVKKFTQGSIFS